MDTLTRPPEASRRPEIPRLGPYRLVRPLYESPRGAVWGALHGTDLPVAIEVLTAGTLPNPTGRAAFRSLVQGSSRLNHPGVVTVLDFGELPLETSKTLGGRLPEGAPYLVTEYLAGGPLSAGDRSWSWPALRKVLRTVLDVLAHAHARGVVHRHLSPSEVFLRAPDDLFAGVRVGGWGIAGLVEDPVGVDFLAPEQHAADDANVGPATDLYALGCLGWWAATGRGPFEHAGPAAPYAHRNERPPDFVPRFLVPARKGPAGGLEDWLRVLLHKAPEHRYASAADARAAFDELEPDGTDPIEPPTATGPLPAPVAATGTGKAAGDEAVPPAVAALPEDCRAMGPRSSGRVRAAGLNLLTAREIPMFGRERQRDLLWKGLRGVHEDGKPRVVLVRGPSGVGKTRLVEWVARRAYELGGVRTLWIRGDDLAGAVLNRFGLRPGESDDQVRLLVERLQRQPSTETLARILVSGLEKAEETEDDQREPEWRSALRRMIEQDSADRPAMLVVDDAQEADEALELAQQVATPSDRVRRAVLVALIAREDDGLAGRPEVENRISAVLQVSRAKIVHLEPLEIPARRELYGYLGLGSSLAARVDERSKGNPQFAIQLVEDWVTRGLLAPGGPARTESGSVLPTGSGLLDDGWVLAGAEPPMPDDLHDVWAARVLQILQSLPGIAGIHLERAAAMGMEVEGQEWHIACDDPVHGRVSDAGVRLRTQLVSRLVEARLLIEVPRGFRFAHPMMREAVERISRTAGRWGPHHQAIATLLESQERPDPARVGTHWLEAGDPARAIDPLFAGIERGMRRSGLSQVSLALVPLERALRDAQIPEDDLRWARLYVRQATVLRRRGMLIAAGDLADKARLLADRPGADSEGSSPSAAVTVWSECTRELARTLHERGDVPGALLLLQQTAARLLRANARGPELTMVLARMAVLGRTMNQLDDAERWATQAHGILARNEVEDPGLEGYVVGELAVIAARRGDATRALELFEEAAELLRTGVATPRLAEVENNRGEALKQFGRWDEAEAAFLEATRLQELVGANPERPRVNLAICRLHAERHAEARALADEVARTASTKVNGTLAALVRSLCDVANGDSAKIGRDLPPFLQTLRDARLVDPDVAWLAELGCAIAAKAGAKADAVVFATFARDLRSSLGDPEASARAERVLADLTG